MGEDLGTSLEDLIQNGVWGNANKIFSKLNPESVNFSAFLAT